MYIYIYLYFPYYQESQEYPGCCIDTTEGGGRGLCFSYSAYRFLSVEHAQQKHVDAFYLGSGLHLLHMMYPGISLEPLRVQQ